MSDTNDTNDSGSVKGFFSGITLKPRQQSPSPPLSSQVSTWVAYLSPAHPFATKDPPAQPRPFPSDEAMEDMGVISAYPSPSRPLTTEDFAPLQRQPVQLAFRKELQATTQLSLVDPNPCRTMELPSTVVTETTKIDPSPYTIAESSVMAAPPNPYQSLEPQPSTTPIESPLSLYRPFVADSSLSEASRPTSDYYTLALSPDPSLSRSDDLVEPFTKILETDSSAQDSNPSQLLTSSESPPMRTSRNNYIQDFSANHDYIFYNTPLAHIDGANAAANQPVRIATAASTADAKVTAVRTTASPPLAKPTLIPVILGSLSPLTPKVQETTITSLGLRTDSKSMTSTVATPTPSLIVSPVLKDLENPSGTSISPPPAGSVERVMSDGALGMPPPSPPSNSTRPVTPSHVKHMASSPPATHYDGIMGTTGQSSGESEEKWGGHRKRDHFSPKKKNAQTVNPAKAIKVGEGKTKMASDPAKVVLQSTCKYTVYRPIVQPSVEVGGIQTDTATGNDGWDKPDGPKCRWYLQHGADNSCLGSPNNNLCLPVSVTMDKEWSAKLEMSNIGGGWYTVVICISFENERSRRGNLTSAEFDVRHLDASDFPVYAEITCRTLAGQEELSQIKSREEKRICLHRQIKLSRSGFIKVTAMLQGQNVKGARVHYIELQQEYSNPDDFVLYGDGRPDEVIHLGTHLGEDVREHPTIHTYYISAMGTYAVTLCFNSNNQPVIEVWSLLPGAAIAPTTSVNQPDLAVISLSISADGLYIAIHSNERSDNGIPSHIFTVNTNNNKSGSVNIDMNGHQSKSSRSMLSLISLPEGLQDFFGYGTFHLVNMASARDRLQNGYHTRKAFCEEENELYITSDGNEGVISVWDLALNQQVSYFQVEGGNASTRAYLSRDGSLVAVSVKGAITIHETATGVRLGSYPHGLGDNNDFEIVLQNDHAMVLDRLPMKDAREKMVDRKIVAVSDMSVGSVVNIIRMDTKSISAPAPNRFGDRFMAHPRIDQLSPASQSYTSAAEEFFSVTSSTSVIQGTWMTLITISYAGNANRAYRGLEGNLDIPVGPSNILYPAIFMKSTSRLAIVAGRYLYVWKLHDPDTTDPKSGCRWGNVAELEHLWALQLEDKKKYQDTDICQREIYDALVDMEFGEQLSIELRPARWFRRFKTLPRDLSRESIEVVTVPMSSSDTLSITLQERVKQGIRGVVDMYINGNDVCQRAAIRYLQTLVRTSENNPVSCIATLCQFWKHEERDCFERIIASLLPTTDITWVPVINPYEENRDPLAILIKTTEKQPAAIGVAKVIMDYCVSHANSSRNLAFLAPILKSMRGMMKPFPEEVFECLSRMAYIPAKYRSYILDNHIIARPPRWRIQFWKPQDNVLLSNKQEPIMQLLVTPTKPDASNDNFTLPVFMASFDALWFYHDEKSYTEQKDPNKATKHPVDTATRNVLKTAVVTTAMTRKMSRWIVFMHMLRMKLRLRSKIYVECHDFKDFEYFDNPAIAALVAYKWNTMGFSYWLVRFIFQCFYYLLILMAAILQVYLSDPKVLFGVFVAIDVMAVVFIWLEILQATQGWNKYKGSTYNVLDLLAFIVPMAGSVDQIVLFELRINKSICKYVTIIQQAVTEIRVFFVIFAAGIFAFTIGMLHLLHACPVGGCPPVGDISASTGNPQFPMHFFHALSSTYFFMGGRYDPISDKFNSEDWAFHIMMIIYFFFTVILMLNVLIALINKAFDKGDEAWRLAWVESRLRYIESAENMSYHIPGYRASHDCFPTEIYFSATPQQVKAYQERYRKKYSLDSSEQSSLAGARSTAAALVSEARDRSTLDAGGTEGSRKTVTEDRKKEGNQCNEDSDGRGSEMNKNNDNNSNTENDKAILELRGRIQSLQEQSERLIDEMVELIRRR
ncbi:hypothetical protein BGZ98_003923 [Dissophora globulifera]|nr:hypothetical protein BGZ98_003923 [Dissophora globulifera]